MIQTKFTPEEISWNGWGTAAQEFQKEPKNRIQSSFRSIKAVSLEEAVAYMEKNYTCIETVSSTKYQVSYKPCHSTDKDYRKFMNGDLSEDGLLIYSFLIERIPID